MRHHYQTKGTCATEISFDLEGNVVRNVKFENGCEGNLTAIEKLVEGLTVDQLAEKLQGIHCGRKETSCADQLYTGVRMAYKKTNGEG